MENEKLILAILGGAIAFYLYKNGKKKAVKFIDENIGIKTSGDNQSMKKTNTNTETEEQPIISSNNAQQPPTKVESL